MYVGLLRSAYSGSNISAQSSERTTVIKNTCRQAQRITEERHTGISIIREAQAGMHVQPPIHRAVGEIDLPALQNVQLFMSLA